MHWCVNINALQRPFSSDFLLSWLLPSPEESVSSVKYNFLLLRPEIPGHPCCVVADSNTGRKEDVEREWIEYDFTFQLPLALSHTQGIRLLLYCILHPVTICLRCAIKPLYVFYLHATVGRNFKSDPDPVWSLSQKLTGQGPEVGVGLLHLTSAGGCSVVLQKQIVISSGEEKRQRGLRFDCSWDSFHHLLATDKPPHIHVFLAVAWLMERSACVCKRKHTFK